MVYHLKASDLCIPKIASTTTKEVIALTNKRYAMHAEAMTLKIVPRRLEHKQTNGFSNLTVQLLC